MERSDSNEGRPISMTSQGQGHIGLSRYTVEGHSRSSVNDGLEPSNTNFQSRGYPFDGLPPTHNSGIVLQLSSDGLRTIESNRRGELIESNRRGELNSTWLVNEPTLQWKASPEVSSHGPSEQHLMSRSTTNIPERQTPERQTQTRHRRASVDSSPSPSHDLPIFIEPLEITAAKRLLKEQYRESPDPSKSDN